MNRPTVGPFYGNPHILCRTTMPCETPTGEWIQPDTVNRSQAMENITHEGHAGSGPICITNTRMKGDFSGSMEVHIYKAAQCFHNTGPLHPDVSRSPISTQHGEKAPLVNPNIPCAEGLIMRRKRRLNAEHVVYDIFQFGRGSRHSPSYFQKARLTFQ